MLLISQFQCLHLCCFILSGSSVGRRLKARIRQSTLTNSFTHNILWILYTYYIFVLVTCADRGKIQKFAISKELQNWTHKLYIYFYIFDNPWQSSTIMNFHTNFYALFQLYFNHFIFFVTNGSLCLFFHFYFIKIGCVV